MQVLVFNSFHVGLPFSFYCRLNDKEVQVGFYNFENTTIKVCSFITGLFFITNLKITLFDR